MMRASYLIRLDDACPTMSKNWERMEALLDRYDIKPIVAVIPDNQDTNFLIEPPRSDFWSRAAQWQAKGWAIAMHGYQHRFVTESGGLVPINAKSEFAGLDLPLQQEKIKASWNIFISHNVRPSMWVAPAHSFDRTTLRALKEETDIRRISDGIALAPFYEHDFFWIPQQLWSFKWMPFGIFTICLHPNTMSDDDFTRLETALRRHHTRFVVPATIPLKEKKRNRFDRCFAMLWWYVYGLKRKS